METLVGIVNRVIYENPNNDFKIFTIGLRSRQVVKVKGEFSTILPGSKIEVHGRYESHPKYGIAFKADAHCFDYNNDARSICLYIQSIAKWVGPERSMAIAERFKDNIQDIIEKNPERLTEIEGIGEKVASNIAEAWQLNKNLKDIRIFLHGLGLTTLKIKKLVTMFGSGTEEILKDNPWRLCYHGFGFTTCDHIAKKLEKDMRCPQRYRHFILYCLLDSLRSGHLYLVPDQLVVAFNKFNEKSPYPFSKEKIDIDFIVPYLKELKEEGFIIIEGNKVYEVQNYFFENESARLVAKTKNSPNISKLEKINVEKFIRDYELQHGIQLSDAQKDAVISFIKEKVLIITGSPGTGKTTVIKAFVQLIKDYGINFELLTPTGIAAKKLGNTAGSPAYTIHRRFGYKGNKWDFGALNKYQTDVIIIDEMSMVDMEVFYNMMSSIYSSTKIVFVGDNDQLPSVGPGCVLKELISSKVIKTIFLDTIFRQEECSEIIKEAKNIKEGNTDLTYFKSDKTADIWHIEDSDSDRIQNTIIKLAKMLKNSYKKTGEKKHFQIITPRNEGPLSVSSLNEALQGALNPKSNDKKEIKINNCVIRKGDRVIIKKNNYDIGVFNGDIGKAVFITPSSITIDIEDFFDDNRRVEIPMAIADNMVKLAYTITCHNSQGLEYPLIILPLIKAHGRLLLQRNLLYTALTRAKKKCIVLGQTSAVIDAIKNDKIQKRNTIFGERIKKWMAGDGDSIKKLFSDIETYKNSEKLEKLLLLETNNS